MTDRVEAPFEPHAGTAAPVDLAVTVPVIELVDVALTYQGPPPVAALREATLTVYPGDFLAIIGPSGSGKSTLLNILGLLDSPTSGCYILDGLVTSELSEAERTAVRGDRIGFVFQAFHLLPYRTALENVLLATLYLSGRVARRRVRATRRVEGRAILERVGLDDRAFALPTTLSGGERQRVAIARALASRPSLLLCDEPTGNLDSSTAAGVLDLLEELNRAGMTIVIITHDRMVSARARRTVEIRDGVLREVPHA